MRERLILIDSNSLIYRGYFAIPPLTTTKGELSNATFGSVTFVQLGGIAEGTARLAVKASKLPEYPMNIADGHQHVDALSTALATYGKLARAAIDEADKLGDKDTADIFTEISRGVDKWLWFVEAHLQSNR